MDALSCSFTSISFLTNYLNIDLLLIKTRLKRHYQQYEPTLQQLKKKYEVAMKEKMLSKLEKDRAVGQVSGLQNTLKSMESFKGGSVKLSQGT